MVNMVELNAIAHGQAFAVAPPPADRDAGVEQVGNFVVGQLIVAAVTDPDANSAGEDAASVANDIIVDRDVPGAFERITGDADFAHTHAAGAQIEQVAVTNGIIVAAPTKPDAVGADASEFAIFHHYVSRTVSHDR